MGTPLKSLDGQRVLVTGGSGGIGAAIVERLSAEGAWPLIHYGRDRASAEALLERIGGNGSLFQADLSSADGPFLLWQQALEAGRIHALINNAGIRTKAALVNLTKSIAVSFGREGVFAVAIAPGWVRTEMAEAFLAENGKAAAVADIPIGEMAEPGEIAELVSFVLRPSQLSLNGATLDVNGGSYIR